ncbi:MAG TPA: DUF2163 domain-containing protein [Cellvibrio sp.]|nr:DUF2163 domain-containing protein [Cellvibrio sp.]
MVATPERRTHCIRIEPANGDVIRLVLAYSDDLVMSNGEVYRGGIYAQPTDISSTLSGGATVIDFGSVYDADAITRDQIHSGYWDGANIYSFFTDWAFPVEDEEEDRVYIFGKVREADERYTVEMMSLQDLTNQNSGRTITPGCPYVLDDAHVDGTLIASDKSRCRAGPSVVANIPSRVTSIVSQLQFVGFGLPGAYPDDYFGFGEIIFTSGANAGLGYKFVKSYAVDGTITLAQPFYYPIAVDDLFTIRPGCRKSKEACKNKFNNVIHFGGFPDVPQKSAVLKFGGQ